MNLTRLAPVVFSALAVACGSGDSNKGTPHYVDDSPATGGGGQGASSEGGSGGDGLDGQGGEETHAGGGGSGGDDGGGSDATGGTGGADASGGGSATGGGSVGTPASDLFATVHDQVLGGAGQSFAQGVAMAPNGDVVVSGTFVGSHDFGCGALNASDNDIFIARYSETGACLWSKRFGSDSNPQLGTSVAVDAAGNIVIAGTFIGDLSFGGALLDATGNQFSDVYVAKLSADGAHLWSKRFGDINGQEAHALAIDGNNNILVTGMFQNSLDFGGGSLLTTGERDAYLLKLDSNGNHVFSKQFGDDAKQNGVAIAVNFDGSVAIGGFSEGDVDFGGGTRENDDGVSEAFVAWFSANGAHLGSELFEGGIASADALAFTPTGELLVGANFKGSIDFGDGAHTATGAAYDIAVARFGADRNLVDAIVIGDAFTQRVSAIASTTTGSAVIGGRFTGKLELDDVSVASAGNYDGFILEIDAAQGHRYFTYGDGGFQATVGLVRNGSDEIIAVGDFTGTVDFGSGAVSGDQDSFVASYLR